MRIFELEWRMERIADEYYKLTKERETSLLNVNAERIQYLRAEYNRLALEHYDASGLHNYAYYCMEK